MLYTRLSKMPVCTNFFRIFNISPRPLLVSKFGISVSKWKFFLVTSMFVCELFLLLINWPTIFLYIYIFVKHTFVSPSRNRKTNNSVTTVLIFRLNRDMVFIHNQYQNYYKIDQWYLFFGLLIKVQFSPMSNGILRHGQCETIGIYLEN